MSIIRVQKPHDHPYTILDTTALNDQQLSFRARGIHAYLMTKPDNWYVQMENLITSSPREGRDAIYSAMKELETYGYISRQYTKGDNGRVTGLETIVYERPDIQSFLQVKTGNGFAVPGQGPHKDSSPPETDCPDPDKPRPGKPRPGKHPLVRIDLKKDLLSKKEKPPLTPPRAQEKTGAREGDAGQGTKGAVLSPFLSPDAITMTHTPTHEEIPPPSPQGETRTRSRKFPPTGFQITDAMREWASHAVPGVHLERETAAFCDYEFRSVRTDWVATWRNWMRNVWKRLPAAERVASTPFTKSRPVT